MTVAAAVALIPVLVQAGVAIYEAIGLTARGEDPGPAIERARAAIAAIPVRTGQGGTWEADTVSRLRAPAAPRPGASSGQLDAAASLGLRQTEPPPSPFEAALEGASVRIADLSPELRARVLAHLRATEAPE